MRRLTNRYPTRCQSALEITNNNGLTCLQVAEREQYLQLVTDIQYVNHTCLSLSLSLSRSLARSVCFSV